jgi:gas vesicle protein
MNNPRLWRGVGAGVLAGAAVGLLMTPTTRRGRQNMAGKALHAVSGIVDTISDVMNR